MKFRLALLPVDYLQCMKKSVRPMKSIGGAKIVGRRGLAKPRKVVVLRGMDTCGERSALRVAVCRRAGGQAGGRAALVVVGKHGGEQGACMATSSPAACRHRS